MTRQNLAIFENAMRMFSPFGAVMPGAQGEAAAPRAAAQSGARDEEIKDLKDQLAAMRAQIAELAQKK